MDIYVLNSDATKVETIITPQECFEAIEEVEINNAGQLSVKLPVKYYQLIDDLDVMAIHAGGDRFRLYVIISRELQGNILSLTGIGYPNYYLSRVGYIKDIRPKKEPLQSLVTRILDGTPWEVGKASETLPAYTGIFYYQSRLECLSEISQATACEFDFYVAISGNQITKQRVDILSKLGKNNGAWFEYGSNTLEVVAEYDATEVYTQAIGRGKGEEVGDGYGRRIEFTDVEWKKSQGYPVDKPKGKNFVNDPTTAYRLPGNKHLLKIIEFDEIEDPWELLQATYDWLIDNNRPKVQFRTTVADGHTLGLGDIVRVVRPDIGVRYDTRVFKLTRNLLQPSLSSVEFGEKIASTPMDKINSMTQQIGQVAGSVDRIEQQVSQINVDGSTITYGPNEPTKKAEGDMWYKTVDGEVVGLLMWDGQQWVTVVDPALEEKINAEIEKVQQDVESSKQQAQDASEKANQAITEAGNAMDTLTKFQGETENEFAEIKGDINGLQTTVSNIQVGGFNYFKDSATMKDDTYWKNKGSINLGDGEYTVSGAWATRGYQLPKLYEDLSGTKYIGESFIFSLDIKIDSATSIPADTSLVLYSDSVLKGGITIVKMNDLEKGKWLRLSVKTTGVDGTASGIIRVEMNKSVTGGVVHVRRLKLERGNVATAWEPEQEVDLSEIEGSISQLTQTSETIQAKVDDLAENTESSLNILGDQIGLKVDKNDVIHQINVSTEGILIDGGKTHITGQTTIDNAVITSAMIKDVNAGKITTGTLNANNVKIINLDVNTLTGNKAKFIQAAFKDANRSTTINAQGILTKNSHMTTALNAGRLEFRDKGGHLTGSIETNDTLLVNGYDDTMLFKILGRRQLVVGFSSDEDENSIRQGLRIKERDIGTTSNNVVIECPRNFTLTNASNYGLKFGTYAGDGMDNSPFWGRIDTSDNSISTGVVFGKTQLLFLDYTEANNMTLNDIYNGRFKGFRTPKEDYPVVIVDSTINGNKALAIRSSEGGNAVVINNANVKVYAKYDLIFGDGYGDALTLNQIRNGYMNRLTTLGYKNETSINVATSSIIGQTGNYFSLLSKSGQAGIYWGTTQMYLLVEGTVYSVKDILRACKLL